MQVAKAPDYNARPDNRRVLLDEFSTKRGVIMLRDDTVVAQSVPVDDQYEYQRQYPIGPVYAAATGFYSFVFGRSAIEQAQNDVLSGRDDRLFVRRFVDMLTGQTREGGSVRLTLDPVAQQTAYDSLQGFRGAVVALDPTTGEILAMVTLPTYDPNPLASHDIPTQQDTWDNLNADPSRPMENRAINRNYPPGSTFKVVTAAAALESGRYAPDSVVPGPAVLDVPQTSADIHNSNGRACGPNDQTTLTNALRISCNTAFAAIGLDLGDDALREQAERFGFNSPPMTDLRADAAVFPEEDLDAPQTAQSAIGQRDVRANALQMAMVSAAIANDGVLMKPYLVSEVLNTQLEQIERIEPQQQSQAVSPQSAQGLTEMMIEVVENGTGTRAQIDGIQVAGKTGTAQTTPDAPPFAWFTSFAPADDPKVAVAVVIEDAGTAVDTADDIAGGRLAAPIARAVMEAVLNQ